MGGEMTVSGLYLEINLFCVAIFLLIMVKSTGIMRIVQQGLFFRANITSIVFILSDTIVYMRHAVHMSPVLIMALKNIYFLSTTFMCLQWMKFFSCMDDEDRYVSKRKQALMLVPFAVQVTASIVNISQGFLFYVDEEGIFRTGRFFLLQYIFAYFYVVVAAGRAIAKLARNSNYVEKDKLIMTLGFLFLPAAAGILQYFIRGLPAACIAMAFCVLSFYLDAISDIISIDPLTKLNNRKELMRTISRRMRSYRDDGPDLYLFMVDANLFKGINDTYGHLEGDKALKRIADAMREACKQLKRRATISRYGGDEFVIAAELERGESPNRLSSEINRILGCLNQVDDSPYELTVSIGIAKYDPMIGTVRQFISMADEELYKIKKSRR